MKYRLSRMAQTDLDDIWYFIARDNPDAADPSPGMQRNVGRKGHTLKREQHTLGMLFTL